MTVVPQQYTVQCILSGIKRHFRWYYVYNSQSIEFDCSLPIIGYRNRYLTVTGKFFYYLMLLMMNTLLSTL